MSYGKRFFVLVVLLSGFAAAPFAATGTDRRPFKLGLAAASQPEPAGAATFSVVEIAVLGGYMGGFGRLTAKNPASDLLTGVSSPWYGAGYQAFSWVGAGVPAALDADMAAPLLTKEGAGLAGIKLGINISRYFQQEVYFMYGFSGFGFDPAAWARFGASRTSAVSTLQGYGRTVQIMDKSSQKAGKTILAGISFNLSLVSRGAIQPYVSIGAGLMSVSDVPSIAWSLNQATSGDSSAAYGLRVAFTNKTARLLSAAAGVKCPLGAGYGLKLEVRGNMAFLSLGRTVTTTFQRTDADWIEYVPYNATALTEKGLPIFTTATVGFYFGL